MDYKVGDRIIIVKAEGQTIGKDKLPLKDPHPEHIGKTGIIVAIDSDDHMPHIRLDDGTGLLGCECWWNKTESKREILVKRIKTGEVVKRVDVTGESESHVEQCMRGMLINMNQEDYRIEDTDWGKER